MRDHFLEFEISPELVSEMVEAGENLILLDVREDWEWEKAHLEGAIHIPLSELGQRIDELDSHHEENKSEGYNHESGDIDAFGTLIA